MLVEYARNVLGVDDADYAESNPTAERLVVTPLACSLAGQEHRVTFAPGSLVASLHGEASGVEPFYCNYGLSADYRPLLEDAGLAVSALDADGEVRAVELPGHPFFVATLYVPQARATGERPHPLLAGFLRAAELHGQRSATA